MSYAKYILAAVVFSGVFLPLKAQKTNIYTNEITEYRQGMELFDKEKYGASQRQFDKTIARINDPNSEISINAEYYAALCAVELFNKDAAYKLTQFILSHPESPKAKSAYFHLAKYNFRKKKYDKVIAWFNKVDIYDLTNDELAEYYFKLGYSYFRIGDSDNAIKTLYEIKDVDTRYTAPARYYYAHIAYRNGNYQTALQTFLKLQDHPKFKPIVPYYITQIYYMQEKYDALIAYAPALLDSAIPKRAPEIARLIGDSYYRTGKYQESIPYLETYAGKANTTKEDRYQLGYACYKGGKLDKAIRIFKGLTNAKDEMGQACFYHLADCYLKKDKKPYARNAFHSASKLSYDKKIKEDALFNYARLSYELAYDPYHKAIGAFKQYIGKYPGSARADEAYSYLVSLYSSTKNYQAALESLESIEDPAEPLKSAYQNLAYNRGVELYQMGQYANSIANFKKVRTYPVDNKLNTLSRYWTGEAYYHMKQYDKAIDSYSEYIFEPGAILQEEFNLVNYHMGYAYFQQQDYDNSAIWFRKFVASNEEKDQVKLNDAYIRIGDAFFVSRDFDNARDYYQKAIDLGLTDTDYAMYQQAMAMGILKEQDNKLEMLEKMLADFPSSSYAVDAKYQLGKGFISKDENERALAYFDDIVNNYPNSSYVKKALLHTGLIHYNNKENEMALAIFKRIVSDYPTYNDSREALAAARNIYIEMDNIEEWVDWMNNLAFVDVSLASVDSATYEAAELVYMDGKCGQAVSGFSKYIDKFGAGIFSINAQFYKAECEYQAGNYESALTGYDYVINQSINKFTESSLVKASEINFHSKRYEDALSNYIMLEKVAEYKSNLLEARTGQMRCFFILKNYDSAIEYSNKVLASDKQKLQLSVEAHLTIANSSFELGNLQKAQDEYSTVAGLTRSEKGAEAKYRVALIHSMQKNHEQAENTIFELVNEMPSHEDWIARGLLLLADVYVAQEEIFQAKATLQSIIENSKGDEWKVKAQEKLDVIIESERKKEEDIRQQEEFNIEFDSEYFDVDSLFPEEELEEEPVSYQIDE